MQCLALIELICGSLLNLVMVSYLRQSIVACCGIAICIVHVSIRGKVSTYTINTALHYIKYDANELINSICSLFV